LLAVHTERWYDIRKKNADGLKRTVRPGSPRLRRPLFVSGKPPCGRVSRSAEKNKEKETMNYTKQLVDTLLGGDTVKALSKGSGAKKSQVESLIGAALPVMLANMQKSASTKKGEASLTKAISEHAADDTSDVKALLGSVDSKDGAKILGHIFGDDTKKTVAALSKKAGTTKSQTVSILTQLAPLLLSLLGQQNQSSSGGIGSILGTLLGTSSSGSSGSLLSALLGSDTSDAAGSLIGSLLGSGSSSSSSSGGVAGTLLSSLLSGDDDDDDDDDGGLGSLLGGLLGGGSSSGSSSVAGSLLGSLFGDDSQK